MNASSASKMAEAVRIASSIDWQDSDGVRATVELLESGVTIEGDSELTALVAGILRGVLSGRGEEDPFAGLG